MEGLFLGLGSVGTPPGPPPRKFGPNSPTPKRLVEIESWEVRPLLIATGRDIPAPSLPGTRPFLTKTQSRLAPWDTTGDRDKLYGASPFPRAHPSLHETLAGNAKHRGAYYYYHGHVVRPLFFAPGTGCFLLTTSNDSRSRDGRPTTRNRPLLPLETFLTSLPCLR